MYGNGKMARWSTALAALAEDPSVQWLVTLRNSVPEKTPSSDLHRDQAHIRCIESHASKTAIHTK